MAVLVFLFTLHFTILGIQALYPNKYSFYYTYPFFQQNWSLFVPAPSENYDLYCTYTKEGADVKRNILQEALNAHKTNSISGNELILNGFLSSIHYFKNDQSTSNLRVLKYFTRKILENDERAKIQNLRIFVVVSPVDSMPVRVYHTSIQ